MLFERGAPLGGEPRRGPRPLADETLAHLGVTGLFQEGHAERRPGRDQRSVAVVLTPKGTETAARELASRERALSDAVGVLTLGERKALTGALEKVLARITADRAMPTRSAACATWPHARNSPVPSNWPPVTGNSRSPAAPRRK